MTFAGSVKKIIVSDDQSIRSAIEILNDGHKRIVLITDKDDVLVGVLADADIRRYVLTGKSFDEPVSTIMKRNPVVANKNMSEKEILNLMTQTHCLELPRVDENGKVIDLVIIHDLLEKRNRDQSVAFIMAGGLGTRLMPLTESIPKPLIEIGGKPILFILIENLLAFGIEKIYISVNYKGQLIKEAVARQSHFKNYIHFIEEDQPLGTAGALSMLPQNLSGPIVVTNADLLTTANISEMMKQHISEGNAITVALREETYQVPFGVARLQGTQIIRIDEKPLEKHFINAGIYVVESSTLKHIPKGISFDMPSLINKVCQGADRVGSFPLYEYWKDIGEAASLTQARSDHHAGLNSDPSFTKITVK